MKIYMRCLLVGSIFFLALIGISSASLTAAKSLQLEISTLQPDLTNLLASSETLQIEASKLHPDLLKVLASAGPDERLNVIVEMHTQANPKVTSIPNRLARRRALVSTLQETAQHTQTNIQFYLLGRQLVGQVERFRPFWIFNGLAVSGAQPLTIYELAARADVALIRLDHWRQWIDAPANSLSPQTKKADARLDSVEWGVAQIRADQVWSAFDISGTGVVVANLDTGVDWLHVALQSTYRGYDPKGFHQHEGNWFDATDRGALRPVDGHGHGTHTMGTIVGQGGIGVAPGARWIAVCTFDSSGSGYDSWVHAAFEWILAPAGDPALAPDVLNNSWGKSVGNFSEYQRDVDALRAAGIFGVFSTGNNGPNPGTVGSPANLPGAFAVGASDQEDEVTIFSSRGPSPWGQTRPHVVAPGVNTYSALPGDIYGEMQGTSMAAPHVTGVAALVLSVSPTLDITQTSYVLTSTAVPLSATLPNNENGYGRVDAFAAVALAGNAGWLHGNIHSGGAPIPGASIEAFSTFSGTLTTAVSDEQGQYDLFLRAGVHRLTIQAFGYETLTVYNMSITTGANIRRDFQLAPLPTGVVQGTVLSEAGGSVAAKIAALGTPVSTWADGAGGAYELALPTGHYTLKARALGYRLLTATLQVTAGQTSLQNFILEPAPRILLVDSGKWYYDSQIEGYRQALDALRYVYKEWPINQPPNDTPTAGQLSAYDVVIWSSPTDSPGLAQADESISNYLSNGGRMLISGQDVGYWDGGGSLIYLADYFLDYLYTDYVADNAPSRQISGSLGGLFQGITLTIQGPGGADNQLHPDQIAATNPDYASLVFDYVDAGGGGVAVGFCKPYRVLYLGFGFEAINQAAHRQVVMERALDWLNSPRDAHGLELIPQTKCTLAGQPGRRITHQVRLRNTGETGGADSVHLQVSGDEWQASLSADTFELGACQTALVDIEVLVPASASWNEHDAITLTAHSTLSPTLNETLVLTSKAPAPVLLVDDDRWYHQEQLYESALQAAGVTFDYWEVTWNQMSGKGSPPADVLGQYPIVLWFTGYDWYDTLHISEESRLSGYLDDGGRFLLSSQSYLGNVGLSEFALDYFGVLSYTFLLSQTHVAGAPDSLLGAGLALTELDYPFENLSASLLPHPDANVQFRSASGQPGALAYASLPTATHTWRTALFAFPLEAMPPETRTKVLRRAVGYMSWLGNSGLYAERALVAPGDELDYTLVTHNDGPGLVSGVEISNTLPLYTTLVTGPTGGASYSPSARRVEWIGDLAAGQSLTITYRLRVSATLPPGGTALPPAAELDNVAQFSLGDQGIHFERHARVRVNAADLSTSRLFIEPASVQSGQTASVTLVLRNTGLTDAISASLDNPLPWPMHLITATLSWSGSGQPQEGENRVLWSGPLSTNQPLTISYQAFALSHDPLWLLNAFQLSDGLGGVWEIQGGLDVEPLRFYLPIVVRE